ncbi:DUF6385 domain-containing protein [Maledivibacter halophilus]|uniref:DUF6385 domain-containing protein n=1 Tax=Maledivibacter halophilus TaxID=36842 RepID=A0A1T5M8N0_9FIRM|nr:DUF6385 domain-containing protein [Maledivibacter halophilus]SKC84209.1 hypothetical protein SAMN02194393_04035 [Maledivibacter halophilus]
MPNNLVFNGVAEQLQTLINGVDADGNVRPIRTDSDGQIQLGTVTVTAENFDIRPLSGVTDSVVIRETVSVTAENFDIRQLSGVTDSVVIRETVSVTAENFDIRQLSGVTDSVVIRETVSVTAENFDIRPLSGATDSIQLSSRLLTEDSLAFEDVTVATATFVQNTGEQSEYSFYVFNTGSNTLTVQLQISPISTDSYFMDDPSGAVGLESGDKVTLVAGRFLKYTRLFYDTGGEACSFNVHYNAQV